MSYGTEAPPLEFDEFDVACLSGRNGQGKSALLDAITWAIWGEARKSSGKRKPDEELIRIGTRHMEVTFTFDLEAERYRVTRDFQRSATGKTTSSNLEFQLYEPGTDAYRPLTGSNQRETQRTIEDTLGLDYDTFINSAFLLQGRSDEFTKKSPSERKEILVNILNLSRYEELARLARDEWREAKSKMERCEAEIHRLKEGLTDLQTWKKAQAEVKKEIEATEKTLDELRAEEKKLTQQRADLEAKAREAESVQDALENLQGRIEAHREERERLKGRIAEAEALLARKEAIQRDYKRYEALQKERNALDEKRDLHRGIEKQVEQKQQQLRARKAEVENRLHRLEVEHRSHKTNLQECVAKLAQRPAIKAKLQEARAAKARWEALEAVRDKRSALREKLSEVKNELVQRKEKLNGELNALKSQIKEDEEALSNYAALQEQHDELATVCEGREALEESLGYTETRGKQLREEISQYKGTLQAERKELAERKAEYERLQSHPDGVCPTCGTDLTTEHRGTALSRMRSALSDLSAKIDRREADIEACQEQLHTLRDEYREKKAQVSEVRSAVEKLATVRERLQTAEQRRTAMQERCQKAEALQHQLDDKAFGSDLRERRTAIEDELSEISLDDDTLRTVQQQAAQLDRWKDKQLELAEAESKRNELERKIEQNEAEAAQLRQQLDDGSAFGTLPDEIEQLTKQLDGIEFDPKRFASVRSELERLSDAGARLNDLLNAQQNRDDWTKQRARTEERLKAAAEERNGLRDKLQALQSSLEQKDELKTAQEQKARQVQQTAQQLNELQNRHGRLSAQLEKAKRDQDALKETRTQHRKAKEQRNLYKHLRKAFSKNGIPSLIIEETLPEIEERANDLLDRLSNGKMHVRLETIKDKKTGGTKETLDIIITDEQGVPRPYETFSGGESFRVNFALRIALAQLLAERNGVRVRTLVIDEGFGTQDEQGIERLVEAIQTIREDFAKILVITHLERLKQAFPVRIEVEKDPVTGSSFEMIGA